MSDTNSAGKSAGQAFRLLREVHRDTFAAMKAVDSLMANKKWYPTLKNRVSDDVSNGLFNDCWLIQSLYRLYVGSPGAKTANKVAGIHIEFEPPAFYEEPVILCLAGTFAQATSTQEMWDKWQNEGSLKLLETLAGNSLPKTIAQAQLKEIFPQASAGKAFVIKLFSLTSESVVQRSIVDPLLATLKEK